MKFRVICILMSGFLSLAHAADSYPLGVKSFEDYRQNIISEIQLKTSGYRLPSAPFALLHGSKTRYSALLIHGLNDSAYYLKDVAQVLFDQGFNVITVLLPGHGRRVEDMHQVQYQDWLNTVRWGIQVAEMLGDKVTVGGFSTGGVLATVAAIENRKIEGLFLIAPALDINGPLFLGRRATQLTCLKGLNQIWYDSRIQDTPIKYRHRSSNAVCQLGRLLKYLYSKTGEDFFKGDAQIFLKRLGQMIQIPTFTVLSHIDHRVPVNSILTFMKHVARPKLTVLLTPSLGKNDFDENHVEILLGPPVAHSYLPLRTNEFNAQQNPLFDQIAQWLSNFIRLNFN